jgi:hypothetical protein
VCQRNLDPIRETLQDYSQAPVFILQIFKRFFAGGDHRALEFTARFLIRASTIREIACHATGGRGQTIIRMKVQQDASAIRRHRYLFAKDTSQASRQSGQ